MKTQSIILVVIAFVVQTACSIGQNKVNTLTPEQVSQYLDKGEITILDVRTPEEWSEGVIDGAVLKNFYDDDFASYLETMDNNKSIIITCKRGGRSAKAANQMQKAGFKEVYNMDAGMDGWNDEKRPTVMPI
jgi:rhodanese-related sulfurtransferase